MGERDEGAWLEGRQIYVLVWESDLVKTEVVRRSERTMVGRDIVSIFYQGLRD